MSGDRRGRQSAWMVRDILIYCSRLQGYVVFIAIVNEMIRQGMKKRERCVDGYSRVGRRGVTWNDERIFHFHAVVLRVVVAVVVVVIVVVVVVVLVVDVAVVGNVVVVVVVVFVVVVAVVQYHPSESMSSS